MTSGKNKTEKMYMRPQLANRMQAQIFCITNNSEIATRLYLEKAFYMEVRCLGIQFPIEITLDDCPKLN